MARNSPKRIDFILNTRKMWIGLPLVISNIRSMTDKIEGKTRGGMLAAALVVKREAVKLAPIDTGNLRNSAYVIAGGGKKAVKVSQTGKEGSFQDSSAGEGVTAGGMSAQHNSVLSMRLGAHETGIGTQDMPFAEIGFTASYALPVHENVKAFHRVGMAKFLEQALMTNRREIRKQIELRAKI